MKKYLGNAYILTLGILISRFLGILFVFPFADMVSPIGLSLYSYAYVPYVLFLDISTLGVPMGIAKMISKYQDNPETCKKIFKYMFLIMIVFGIVSFGLLNILAPYYASTVLGGNDLTNTYVDVLNVIRTVSFALLIMPMVSIIRGYLQGLQNMWPTAISQIVEQGVRVILILVSTYLIINVYQLSYVFAVQAAVFSATIASVFSLLVLVIAYMRRRYKGKTKGIDKSLIKETFSYAIPYAFFGITFSIYQFIDSIFFNTGLINYGISTPEEYYGVYSFEVQKLIFIPISFAIGLSASIMPALVKEDNKEEMIRKAINSLMYWLVPISLFAIIFSNEIYHLFYNHEVGGDILKNYALLIPFIGLNNVLVGIMQGINKQKGIYLSLTVGIVLKGILDYFLISQYSYVGAIFATLIGYLASITINMIYIGKEYKELYEIKKLLIGLGISLLFVFVKNNFIVNIQNRLGIFVYLVINTIIFFLLYMLLNKAQYRRKQIN